MKKRQFGVGESVILKLTEEIPENKNDTVGFDNYFTSLRLLCILRQKRLNAISTIRNNRLQTLKDMLECDKSLKKRGRGSYDWRSDHAKRITIVKWQDNKAITVASNFISHQLGTPAERYLASKGEYEDIPGPSAVETYNKVMNGVDVCDQIMSYYRVSVKSRKWYKYILYSIITAAISNA
jgi:hypothetical protein